KGTGKPISGGSEVFVPDSTGTSGKNGRSGRERAGRPTNQPNHDTCHKEKIPKFKGRGLRGQPEPIKRRHVSYGARNAELGEELENL
ncbi:hypothetical protein KI387_011140, partial [Taxus chinensis]